MMKVRLAAGLVMLLILAGCGIVAPAKTAVQGAELFSVDFAAPGTWEEGVYTDSNGNLEATLAIQDGRYQIDFHAGPSASVTWGAGGDVYENVIIEVETEQLSPEKDTLYGAMCRLATDDSGNTTGYALLISGDGHYGIAEVQGRSLNFLLDWHQSKTIKQGQAANTIRAVCVDDYLAVYDNGKFLGDVTTDTYRRPGQVGLIAGVTGGAEVNVAFDNLAVYDGSIK
jgi:hypothetical protein